jgi:hypothetical protein
MNSLSFIIGNIKNARDVSRIHAQGATAQVICDIANQYAELMDSWLEQLQEVERMYELNRIALKEIMIDASFTEKN